MPRTYTLLVSTVLAKVRRLIQDETSPFRYNNDELIGWLNDAIASMVNLVPGLFTSMVTHTCSSGYRQTIVNTRAAALLDIIGVVPADMTSLTRFTPNWQTAPNGTIANWMRNPAEPLSFFCYPPSAEGQVLSALIVEKPATLSATSDLVPVPEHYEPALVDYVASMAQFKDDEHVDTNRQQQLMANFAARVKGA